MKKMNSTFKTLVLPMVFLFLMLGCSNSRTKSVDNKQNKNADSKFTLVALPDENRVEVWIDSLLFTSYIYPSTIAKPVLNPLTTLSGKVLTRSYPLETIPGERVDHPHHIGAWLNYGDVNGLDFWNNSDAIAADVKDQYGSIFHKEILNIENGDESGILEVACEWKAPNGSVLLEENTKFIFSTKENSVIIDRYTTLKALDDEVSFKDNKEGMIGIRVARALELPSDKPDIFLDVHGNPTETKVLDNTGVTGNYLSSEGVEGDAAWGTRGRWMKLYGSMENEKVALVIIDHPENTGYPTYWHARGYGLFAANPLGQAIFSNGKNVLGFKLAPHEEVGFKYRIIVHSATELSVDEINALADDFSNK
ncbi:MAG: PmoA family protein [Bacteroidales bacterium]|nr:PmoA family protein [Bacteroidales bacterium]MCF8391529.1 PmoA family protein [Bacteroidales bacterium]